MKRIVKAILASLMVVTALPLSAVSVKAETTFGDATIYAPKEMLNYPLAGDSVTLSDESTVTLANDGDVPYKVTYSISDAGVGIYDSTGLGAFGLYMYFSHSMSYARLLDTFQFEFVVELDSHLEPKKDSSDNYIYTFDSPYLRVKDSEVYVDAEGKIHVPCEPKTKFAEHATSKDDVQTVLDAIQSKITFTAVARFKTEAAYDEAKTNNGKIVSGGTVRVYPPLEAQRDNPNGQLMTAIRNTFGASSLLGTVPNQYLEVSAKEGTTLLESASAYVAIDKTGNYAMHSDGHAIFWLANAQSVRTDTLYQVYEDSALTQLATTNQDLTWDVEMVGGFVNSDFTSEMTTFLPTSSRNTTWTAGSSSESIAVESAKSGIYKVTVTASGNSDYCYVVIPGDVNRNSRLQISDANAIFNYLANSPREWEPRIPNDEFTNALADMNGNKRIQPNDGNMIMTH